MKTAEEQIAAHEAEIQATLENTRATPMRKLQRLVALEHGKNMFKELKDAFDKAFEDDTSTPDGL